MAYKFWMVVREDGGNPSKRHSTHQAACAEAERLAQQNPGNRFHVLEPIVCFETAKPSVLKSTTYEIAPQES